MSKWTQFMDMNSGGGQKLDWAYIYIEASQEEAGIIFQNRFGRNPHRVTCTCCGSDYSISEDDTLKQASGYERNCLWYEKGKFGNKSYEGKYFEKDENIPKGWKASRMSTFSKYQTLREYRKREDILIIPKREINAKERKGELQNEGYMWI